MRHAAKDAQNLAPKDRGRRMPTEAFLTGWSGRAKMAAKKRQGAFPGQLGSGRVIARWGVVVEAVLGAQVLVPGYWCAV